MATSMVHIRIDEDLKKEASKTLENMGLSVSDAVRVFSYSRGCRATDSIYTQGSK